MNWLQRSDDEWNQKAPALLREFGLPLIRSYDDAMRICAYVELAYRHQSATVGSGRLPPIVFTARLLEWDGVDLIVSHHGRDCQTLHVLRAMRKGNAMLRELSPTKIRFEREYGGRLVSLEYEAGGGRSITFDPIAEHTDIQESEHGSN